MIKYASANLVIEKKLDPSQFVITPVLRLFKDNKEISKPWYEAKSVPFIIEENELEISISNLNPVVWNQTLEFEGHTADKLTITFSNGSYFPLDLKFPKINPGESLGFEARNLFLKVDKTALKILNILRDVNYI